VSALTRLRTFNGPALVERCYQAWNSKSTIQLHYRNDMGVEQSAPILAARNVETSDGHVLLLWVYLDHDKVEFELDKGDDEADEDNLE
jgi:hypothetical protein